MIGGGWGEVGVWEHHCARVGDHLAASLRVISNKSSYFSAMSSLAVMGPFKITTAVIACGFNYNRLAVKSYICSDGASSKIGLVA